MMDMAMIVMVNLSRLLNLLGDSLCTVSRVFRFRCRLVGLSR
jgi:hypothetical protein